MTHYSDDALDVLKRLRDQVNLAISVVENQPLRPMHPYQPPNYDVIIGDFGIDIISGPFITKVL